MGKVVSKLRLGGRDWLQPVLIVEGLLVPCFCVILVPSLKLLEGDIECSRSDENSTGVTHAALFDAPADTVGVHVHYGGHMGS